MNPMKMMGDADKLSIPQLQQSIQNGTIPAYIGVPLLQEKVKQQKAMQASMAAPQGPAKPPVAQQVMQEAQGVSALPSNLPEEGYADGGIVAFAGGGPSMSAPPKFWDAMTDWDKEQWLERQGLSGISRQLPTISELIPERLKRGAANIVEAYQNPYVNVSSPTQQTQPPTQQPVITQKPNTNFDFANPNQAAIDILSEPAKEKTDPDLWAWATKYRSEHPSENLQAGVVGKGGVGGADSTGFAQVPSYNIAMPEFDTEGYKALQYSPEELDKAKAINEAKGFYGTDPEAAKLAEKIKGREADLAGEKDKAPWMALMQAGLATMAGTSPFALTNIGAGGQAGLEAFTKAKDKFEDRQDKLYEMQGRLADKKRAEELAAINHGINSVEHKEAANRTAKQAELTAKADYAYKKAHVGIQNAQLGIDALYKNRMGDYYAQKGSGATKYNSEQTFIQDILDNKDAPFNAKYFDAEGNFDRGRAIAEYNRLKKQNLLDVSNGMDIFGGSNTQEAPAPQFKLRSIKSQ